MNEFMNVKRRIALILMILLALLLVGCSEHSSALETADLTSLHKIGTQEGETVYQLAIENRSGFAITALSAKCEEKKEFTGNTLKKGEPFDYGEIRLLCFASSSPASAPGDYEMSLVLGRDLFRTIHSVPFSETDRCTIYSDGDYCYLEYKTFSGETVSTKKQERALYEAEEELQNNHQGCIGDEGLVY